MKRIALTAILLLAVVAAAQADCLLTFLTESLPAFFVGEPAHFTIEAVSGTEPYTFSLNSGTLPAGMHLHSDGRLTGVPREEADTTIFVTVTDAAGCQITQAFAVRVIP
jgi:hypothetical protein